MAASTDFYQRAESFCFVGGLIFSGAVLMGSSYHTIIPPSGVSLGRTVIAALLVEFGARVQNGCTSGHGICGLSRLSVRSLAAVGVQTLRPNPCSRSPLFSRLTVILQACS
jgi:uncharacterized membrane protein YedE/YeeE